MSYIPSPVFEMLGIGFRVLCCGKSSMFVIPANEGSIETWNRGTHTHTHTHDEARVTGSQVSSTLYINSHRPGKPPIGVRTVKLLPDNGPRSHLRETRNRNLNLPRSPAFQASKIFPDRLTNSLTKIHAYA